jgi:hypothetical protein
LLKNFLHPTWLEGAASYLSPAFSKKDCRRAHLVTQFQPIYLPLDSITEFINRINVVTRHTVPFSLISGGHAKLPPK